MPESIQCSAPIICFTSASECKANSPGIGQNKSSLPISLNIPYKPFYYDFNAIYASPLTRHHLGFELLGGVGVQNTRFYVSACSGSSCFGTTNHLMIEGGGGIKYYFWRNFFFRPEGRYYFILHNVEFSSDHAIRYGASFGYTFRGDSRSGK